MEQVKSDPFWTDQPSILYDRYRLVEFVPTSDMTLNEKLNACSRFVIYVGLLLYLIHFNIMMIYIPIIGLFIIWLVHRNYHENTENFSSSNGFMTYNPLPSVKPTEHNPFMNVMLTDYVDDPNRPPAASISDPKIQEDMEKMFSSGLYRDVDDVWNKNNSQRQYYTNPNTIIPNDRESFMNWCWKTPYVCKDGDGIACLKYEDLRGHGKII